MTTKGFNAIERWDANDRHVLFAVIGNTNTVRVTITLAVADSLGWRYDGHGRSRIDYPAFVQAGLPPAIVLHEVNPSLAEHNKHGVVLVHTGPNSNQARLDLTRLGRYGKFSAVGCDAETRTNGGLFIQFPTHVQPKPFESLHLMAQPERTKPAAKRQLLDPTIALLRTRSPDWAKFFSYRLGEGDSPKVAAIAADKYCGVEDETVHGTNGPARPRGLPTSDHE